MWPRQSRAPQSASRPAASPRLIRRPSGPSRIRALRPPRLEHNRRVAIANVLALWPHELEDESPGGRQRLLARLRQALRAERRRGLSGHWTYDLARHVELLRVYRTELAAVAGRANDNATAEYPTASRAARRRKL
jgi:hypothetical protein